MSVEESRINAVLSGNATQRLQDSPLSKVIVTNSLPIPPEKGFPKLHVVSVGLEKKPRARNGNLSQQARPKPAANQNGMCFSPFFQPQEAS